MLEWQCGGATESVDGGELIADVMQKKALSFYGEQK